jgi:hypothetical protein
MTILHCNVFWMLYWSHMYFSICWKHMHFYYYIRMLCIFKFIDILCISKYIEIFFFFKYMLNNWKFWFIIYHILVRKLCIRMRDFCFWLWWALKLGHNNVISFLQIYLCYYFIRQGIPKKWVINNVQKFVTKRITEWKESQNL